MSDPEKASIGNGTEASQSTEGLDAFMQRALSKSSSYQKAARKDAEKKKSLLEELETEIGKDRFHDLLQTSKEELNSELSSDNANSN
jgi:hypothetical protein